MPKNENKLGNVGCGKPLILLDITVLLRIETALSGRLNECSQAKSRHDLARKRRADAPYVAAFGKNLL
jgi:hypothetical protein